METLIVIAFLSAPWDTQTTDPASDAQPSPVEMTPEQRDELARKTFANALQMYDAGNYENAIELFARSHDLSGRDAIFFNIANAQERNGNYTAAADALERYANQTPPPDNAGVLFLRIKRLRKRAAEAVTQNQADEATRRETADLKESVAQHREEATAAATEQAAELNESDPVSFSWGWIPWIPAPLSAAALVAGVVGVGSLGLVFFEKQRLTGSCVEGASVLCTSSAGPFLQREFTYAVVADVAIVSTAVLTVAAATSWAVWGYLLWDDDGS